MAKPKQGNKYDPIATAQKSAERVLLGASGQEKPLTVQIMQEIANIAKDTKRYDTKTGQELTKFEIFQSMLFERYGANSSYALFAIGAKGKPPSMPADDGDKITTFTNTIGEGIRLVNTRPLSVHAATTLQTLDAGRMMRDRDGEGATSFLKALDRLHVGVSVAAVGGKPEGDATKSLKDLGLSDGDIALIGTIAATQKALKEDPQASYDDVIKGARESPVTFQDLEYVRQAYLNINQNKGRSEWLIEAMKQYTLQNGIDANAIYQKLKVPKEKADAGLDTGVAVADAGGPESDPTTTFTATVAEVTTAPAAADPADPAAAVTVRRPAAAPETAPA